MQCPYENPSRRQSTENHEDQNVPTQTHRYARSLECMLNINNNDQNFFLRVEGILITGKFLNFMKITINQN